MSTALRVVDQRYGKARVRFVKVDRSSPRQTFREFNVKCQLDGPELHETYFTGNNSKVVPTDTVKNTIWWLAKNYSFESAEEFGALCTRHFLSKYPWVHRVFVEVVEPMWERAAVDGRPHNHTFFAAPNGTRKAVVNGQRGQDPHITSSVFGLKVLKTTGSEFVGFNKCDLTSLPEDRDRLMGTIAELEWTWEPSHRGPVAHDKVAKEIVADFVKTFAEKHSLSLQQTMYDAATAILPKQPAVKCLTLRCPNVHNMPINNISAKDDAKNRADVIVLHPIDEPHGMLEASFERPPKAKL